jgi:hypothetical protein
MRSEDVARIPFDSPDNRTCIVYFFHAATVAERNECPASGQRLRGASDQGDRSGR